MDTEQNMLDNSIHIKVKGRKRSQDGMIMVYVQVSSYKVLKQTKITTKKETRIIKICLESPWKGNTKLFVREIFCDWLHKNLIEKKNNPKHGIIFMKKKYGDKGQNRRIMQGGREKIGTGDYHLRGSMVDQSVSVLLL